MKSKPRILIVLLSAAITFVTLFATIGKPHFAKHHPNFGHCEKTEVQVPLQK